MSGSAIFWSLVILVILWGVYFYLNKKSRDLGIVYDPFKRPTFYAVLAYTIIILLWLIATLIQQ